MVALSSLIGFGGKMGELVSQLQLGSRHGRACSGKMSIEVFKEKFPRSPASVSQCASVNFSLVGFRAGRPWIGHRTKAAKRTPVGPLLRL